MKYPMDKYQIAVHQHPDYLGTEIIARSTYAGATVKGKAICHEGDTYSEEKGIKLAIARCAEKIARKRQARAAMLLQKAQQQLAQAEKYVIEMTSYHIDATNEVKEAQAEITNILAQM
jgi:hypothetical protein